MSFNSVARFTIASPLNHMGSSFDCYFFFFLPPIPNPLPSLGQGSNWNGRRSPKVHTPLVGEGSKSATGGDFVAAREGLWLWICRTCLYAGLVSPYTRIHDRTSLLHPRAGGGFRAAVRPGAAGRSRPVAASRQGFGGRAVGAYAARGGRPRAGRDAGADGPARLLAQARRPPHRAEQERGHAQSAHRGLLRCRRRARRRAARLWPRR